MKHTSENQTPRSNAGNLMRDQNTNQEGNSSFDSQFEQSSHDADDTTHSLQRAGSNENRPPFLNLQPPHFQSSMKTHSIRYSQVQDTQNPDLRRTSPGSIIATLNGQHIGRIHLNYDADLQYILNPPTTTLHIPTTLVLEANPFQLVPNDPSSLPALVQNESTKKRPHPPSGTTSVSKKLKTVDPKATPITSKPASHYAKGIEEPIGMTKNADDSCLTCLRHNRKCKGTDIKIVKGQKRCEACTNPGRNTSGRICYWKTPSKGVHTYEDAQRILAKELGGRVLQKNTRAERVKRQQKTRSQIKRDTSPKTDQTSLDGTSNAAETKDDEDLDLSTIDSSNTNVYIDTNADGELLSAADSAYHSLYTVVAQDLDLPEEDHSTSTRLVVEHAIHGALTGSGTHHDRIEGIDDQVLRVIGRRVEANIALLEAMLGDDQTDQDDMDKRQRRDGKKRGKEV